VDIAQDDLGFVYRKVKSGDVFIHHRGLLAVTLRGKKAASFITKITASDFAEQQQIMARITGNYKRGNEKSSRQHAKNTYDYGKTNESY
jgi:hypothetical protein